MIRTESPEQSTDVVFRIIVKLLEDGVSIRSIARTFGIPKSTLHRWLPGIRAIVFENRSNNARVSHMGQEDQQKAAQQGYSFDTSVPYGTGAEGELVDPDPPGPA